MFVSDAQILSDVQATLKITDPTQFPSYWATVVGLAHQYAYNLILRRLLARGYLLAQILAWDEGPAMERRQALYESLVAGGGLSDANPRWVEKLNVADPDKGELLTCLVYVSGLVQPPQGQTGQCVSGTFDQSQDTVVFPDPDDPLLGQVTRF